MRLPWGNEVAIEIWVRTNEILNEINIEENEIVKSSSKGTKLKHKPERFEMKFHFIPFTVVDEDSS